MGCDRIAGKEYKSRFQGWVHGIGFRPFNTVDSSTTRSKIVDFLITASILILWAELHATPVYVTDPTPGVLSAKQLRQQPLLKRCFMFYTYRWLALLITVSPSSHNHF